MVYVRRFDSARVPATAQRRPPTHDRLVSGHDGNFVDPNGRKQETVERTGIVEAGKVPRGEGDVGGDFEDRQRSSGEGGQNPVLGGGSSWIRPRSASSGTS